MEIIGRIKTSRENSEYIMCSLERVGDVYVLRFLGEANEHRLNPAFVEDIISKLDIVDASDAKALVTVNEGKYFSNGLDLAWLQDDPNTRSPFRMINHTGAVAMQAVAFDNLISRLMHVKVPTVASICGHAVAGGFILAMAHDHRHMRGDRGFLYMSEVDVHIVIPPRLMGLLRAKMDARTFKDVVLKAPKLTGATAMALGLVDSVHTTAIETFDAAMAEAVRLAGRNWRRDVYLGLRLNMFPDFQPRDGDPNCSQTRAAMATSKL